MSWTLTRRIRGVDDPDERKKPHAEYDAFDDRYVSFLLDEVLPQVRQWVDQPTTPTMGDLRRRSGGNVPSTPPGFASDRFPQSPCCLRFCADAGRQPLSPSSSRPPPQKRCGCLCRPGNREPQLDRARRNWLATTSGCSRPGWTRYDSGSMLATAHSRTIRRAAADALRWLFRPPTRLAK